METNIINTFLKFIDKNFPRTYKFHKTFNRDNVKVSYSYLPNFDSKIKPHNSKTLSNSPRQP